MKSKQLVAIGLLFVAPVALATPPRIEQAKYQYSEGAGNGGYVRGSETIFIKDNGSRGFIGGGQHFAAASGSNDGGGTNRGPSKPRRKDDPPPPQPSASECERSCRRNDEVCTGAAEESGRSLRKYYETQARQSCDLTVVWLGATRAHERLKTAEAKGGKSIKNLQDGKSEIPGFTQDDWACKWVIAGDEKTATCYGKAFDSCIESYREDNPSYEVSSDSKKEFGINSTYVYGGVEKHDSVTYHYGPHTGYATSSREVRDQFATMCTTAFNVCVTRCRQ